MSDKVNLVTFHPHAWGETANHRMNAERNPGVPDAYHQAVILRNAAAKYAQDYEHTVERHYIAPDEDNNVVREIDEEPKAFTSCLKHMFSPNSLACTVCGTRQVDLI